LGIVTANELHIPVSDPSHPTPTFLQLLSADTDHSFWVPELAGKTTSFQTIRIECGWTRSAQESFSASARSTAGFSTQRCCCVFSVDSPADFADWVRSQQQPAVQDASVETGRRVFESNACMNCHAVAGTPADDALALT